MAEFTKVATKSEIPTDTGKLFVVNGNEIALFRIGDEIHAIHAVCPHQGGPLHEGGRHGENVMCPWHGWEFNVKNGKCAFNDRFDVPTFKTKIEGEDVFVEA